MAKTLIEFRAEKGLYLKDVAEKIGVTEEELANVEKLNGVPDYIVEKLSVAYNLPENYFLGEKVEQSTKPIKSLKSYFFKTSLLWYFVFTLILSVPVAIVTYITPFLTNLFGLTVTSFVRNGLDFLADIITVGATIVYCNMFAKHIMKKTGLSGDIYKYRYLYEVIPSGAVAAISILTALISTMTLKEALADESKVYLMQIGYVFSLIVSLILMVIAAFVMASLLNTAVMDDEILKAKRHKTMAIIVTVSSVLAYILTIYANNLEPFPTYDAIIRRIFVYGIYIAVAWLVYLAKDNNKTKISFAFEILPIISIVDILLFDLISI